MLPPNRVIYTRDGEYTVHGYSDNSVRAKRPGASCKRGTRARQGDFTGVARARQCLAFSRKHTLLCKIYTAQILTMTRTLELHRREWKYQWTAETLSTSYLNPAQSQTHVVHATVRRVLFMRYNALDTSLFRRLSIAHAYLTTAHSCDCPCHK